MKAESSILYVHNVVHTWWKREKYNVAYFLFILQQNSTYSHWLTTSVTYIDALPQEYEYSLKRHSL